MNKFGEEMILVEIAKSFWVDTEAEKMRAEANSQTSQESDGKEPLTRERVRQIFGGSRGRNLLATSR